MIWALAPAKPHIKKLAILTAVARVFRNQPGSKDPLLLFGLHKSSRKPKPM